MRLSRDEAVDEAARIRVELAAAAADVMPMAEIEPTAGDLVRVQPLLERLAGAVASLLGTDLAVVWTAEHGHEVLVPSAWVGFDRGYISAIRVPYGTGSAGRAVAERRTVLIQDVVASDHYAPWRSGAVEHGVRAVLSVPMLTLGGEPMGALSSYYRKPTEPDDRDLELAAVYAQQAAEIVERARLHSQARQLADLERRRGVQLRALADSALALSAADGLDELLAMVTESAVAIVGCHQGVTTRLPSGWADASSYVSLSERYAEFRGYDVVPAGLGVVTTVTRDNRPLRLTGEQLRAHPAWRGLLDAPGHPPLPDYLAAPLVGREGGNLGLVQLSDKRDGTAFSAEDESVLVQLAQMASSTIERLEALEGERAARRQAEAAAVAQEVLSQASALFAERFDPLGIANALVELVVPGLAEVAVVHVVEPDGPPRLLSLQTADPSERDPAREFLSGFRLEPGEPYGAVAALATGRPQLLSDITAERIAEAAVDAEAAAQLRTIVQRRGIAVPLVARGRSVGVLSISRTEPYAEADVAHALDLARRAALALDNASRYAFERDLALTLQRSLLPRQLATGPLFSAAARYLPGTQGTQVGGDWYDLIEVDGALVLVVGDVMGRGVKAAAVMGQLQATVRAYALEGHGPAALLTRLDQVVLAVEDLHFTTCVVVRLDPVTRLACMATAGHPPPVLLGPDGVASLLELDPGLPLGVGGARFVDSEHLLDPGSLLLLYTDGLVESREVPVGEGLDALVATLHGRTGRPDEVCDGVLAAMGRDVGTDDDTALLAVQLAADARVWRLELALPPCAESARAARHAVRDLVDSHVAELLVTELVANAVSHVAVIHVATSEVVVRLATSDRCLRVEVVDASPILPAPAADPAWEVESGRGLLLVELLAERWGSDRLREGKRVWFELGLPDPA